MQSQTCIGEHVGACCSQPRGFPPFDIDFLPRPPGELGTDKGKHVVYDHDNHYSSAQIHMGLLPPGQHMNTVENYGDWEISHYLTCVTTERMFS